jgi:predicted nuclease of restriction endonuclease-like (RecB) superfamily
MSTIRLGTIRGLSAADIRRLMRELLEMGWSYVSVARSDDVAIVTVGLVR